MHCGFFWSIFTQRNDADIILLLKKLSLSDISFTGTTIINVLVEWDYNEYSSFNVGQKYVAGLFPKFAGEAIADENTDTEFEITFTNDTLKQN